MTEANLVTIDTNNYDSMAKAMGIANETNVVEKKAPQLPRFRINHAPIEEDDEIIVKGGTYKLDIPEGQVLYGKTATIRPFMQRYMYKRFVKNMSAKAGEFNQNAQGLFIKSPDLFQLQYLRDGKDHPFLNNFKLCALTGMNINYTNAGTYTSYSDGTPVNIRMDVTFKEINPVYAEDYLPGNGSGMGVGF